MEGFPGSIAHIGPQIVTKNYESNYLRCRNLQDIDGNPAGGYVNGVGITINWQDGPRAKDANGNLLPANGAFVEDAIQAAAQRLWFFQQSKFKHDDNAEALEHLNKAMECLARRAKSRAARGVLGSNIA